MVSNRIQIGSGNIGGEEIDQAVNAFAHLIRPCNERNGAVPPSSCLAWLKLSAVPGANQTTPSLGCCVNRNWPGLPGPEVFLRLGS